MKPFLHVLLPTGHRYEIPTDVIAQSRAAYYHQQFKDTEFPTLEAALEDTQALFEDTREVKDWALNNMSVEDLMQHARLVRYEPPEHDLQAGDWSFHDAPALIPQIDAQTVLSMPLEMAVSAMAAHRNLCQMVTLNDAAGEPGALVVLVKGPSVLVAIYTGALQHLTNSLLLPQPAPQATEQSAIVLQ